MIYAYFDDTETPYDLSIKTSFRSGHDPIGGKQS